MYCKEEKMKTYRIKHQFAPFLMGLHGLYMNHTECWDYVDLHVLDNQTQSNLGARSRLTSLSKSCDSELINDVLEQIQFDNVTSESMEVLRKYLQCAEKKDKNNEIKSEIKQALKEIFLSLLLIAVGGVGGLALTAILMGLFPAIASWISLLIIPAVAAATCGVIKALIGCLKLGIGIFSLCFRQKNTGQLPALEDALRRSFFQSSPPPPSYPEVVANNTAFPTALYPEPPTYHQAVKNSTSLSIRAETPPVNIPASVLPYYSAHFFHHPHPSGNQVVNDNPSPVCRHYCN